MNKARDILCEFRTPENLRYGVLILTATDASMLIQKAEEAKVRVLGIDSFRVCNGTIQPLMEHSVDYSSRGFVCDSDWKQASDFIRQKVSLGLLFEVVLGEEVVIRRDV